MDNNHLDSKRFKINTQDTFSLFKLNQIQVDDTGNYSCVVDNSYGFDSQWSFLEVKGLDLKILLKCGAISITWGFLGRISKNKI